MGKPIKFEILNADKAKKRFDKLPDEYAIAIAPAIKRGALRVANRIVRTLQRGSRSGRIYTKPGGTEHQASAPGEAPKSDTGFLASHVRPTSTKVAGTVVSSDVIISAPYAGWLEDGTTNMAARPYVEPSFLLEAPGIDDDVARRVRSVV